MKTVTNQQILMKFLLINWKDSIQIFIKKRSESENDCLNYLECIWNEILTSYFFPEFKQFTWFLKNSRHSRENLITVKSFFHCLKLGNMHAETKIVTELYDVTGMSEDSRRWVSLWRLTKKNARLFSY